MEKAGANTTPPKIESDRAAAAETADIAKKAKAAEEKAVRLLKASRRAAKELEKVRGQQLQKQRKKLKKRHDDPFLPSDDEVDRDSAAKDATATVAANERAAKAATKQTRKMVSQWEKSGTADKRYYVTV